MLKQQRQNQVAAMHLFQSTGAAGGNSGMPQPTRQPRNTNNMQPADVNIHTTYSNFKKYSLSLF